MEPVPFMRQCLRLRKQSADKVLAEHLFKGRSKNQPVREGTKCDIGRSDKTSKEALKRQAERAESIADQTVDESLKAILQQAAQDYRKKAEHEDD
jgi:hypothetical protein